MIRRPNIEFGLLVLFSIVFWWQPIASTAQLAWTNEAYTHILLIVPLSIALACFSSNNRDSNRPDSKTVLSARPTRLGGLFLFAVVLGLACFVRWGAALAPDIRLSLSMVALVCWWIATVVFCFGLPVLRAFLFPLCFLFWLVPFPNFLLNWIVPALQNGSALAAKWMFQLARVPVTLDGVVLSVPGLEIEVARECSSIRSSLLLIVTTMVLAQLFLRSPWRRLILVLVALPLSVAKNGMRIFVITELALRVDMGYLEGRLHRHGGIIFLTIAWVLIVGVLWALARRETDKNSQLSAVSSQ